MNVFNKKDTTNLDIMTLNLEYIWITQCAQWREECISAS